MATTPVTKPPVSNDTHGAIIDYFTKKRSTQSRLYNMRSRMQYIDRVYQRELDWSLAQQRAKAANMAGDISKMQNVVVPVVMPQVESMLTYLSDTFLASYPLFPVVSRPKLQAAALQMETVIGEQAIRFSWGAELTAAMRDQLKYNLGAVEVSWAEEQVPTIETDLTSDVKNGKTVLTDYVGNKLQRIDPYNLIVDVRVQPFEVHTKGEFVGYTELISKIEMKRRISRLDSTKTMRVKEAFESGEGVASASPVGNGHYIPQVNADALVSVADLTGQTNWDSWAGIEENPRIHYHNRYEWAVLYARILPAEFKIMSGGRNTPQIWKFIVINGKVCIFAEQVTNAHDYLPIIVAQAHEDGLGWQAKSFADNAAPFQAIATSLFNSGLESQRRKVYDRIIYDPSRINKADIEKTSPVARIPIKTEAYGKPLNEAVYQIPYRDDNVGSIFNTAQLVLEMADVAVGQNRVQRGQFQKGNKTRTEFQDTMNNSDSRPRMVALLIEQRFFQPIKHIVKLNTLQYQPPDTLFNRTAKQQVKVDPVELRKAQLEFKIADGVMPTSQYVNFDTFDKLLNVAAQNPMVGAKWDIVGAFMYYLKLQGASWIDDFEIPQQQGQPNAQTVPQPGAAGNPAV